MKAKFNKVDLIGVVADKAGITKVSAKEAVDAVFAAIQEMANDGLNVREFGKFTMKLKKGRNGVSALTGKEFKTADELVLKFKASASTRESLSNKGKEKKWPNY